MSTGDSFPKDKIEESKTALLQATSMQQRLPFNGAPFIVNEGTKHRVKIQVSNPEYTDKSPDSVRVTCHKTRTVSTTAEVIQFFEEWVEEMYYEEAYDKVNKWLGEQEAKNKQVKTSCLVSFRASMTRPGKVGNSVVLKQFCFFITFLSLNLLYLFLF